MAEDGEDCNLLNYNRKTHICFHKTSRIRVDFMGMLSKQAWTVFTLDTLRPNEIKVNCGLSTLY